MCTTRRYYGVVVKIFAFGSNGSSSNLILVQGCGAGVKITGSGLLLCDLIRVLRWQSCDNSYNCLRGENNIATSLPVPVMFLYLQYFSILVVLNEGTFKKRFGIL